MSLVRNRSPASANCARCRQCLENDFRQMPACNAAAENTRGRATQPGPNENENCSDHTPGTPNRQSPVLGTRLRLMTPRSAAPFPAGSPGVIEKPCSAFAGRHGFQPGRKIFCGLLPGSSAAGATFQARAQRSLMGEGRRALRFRTNCAASVFAPRSAPALLDRHLGANRTAPSEMSRISGAAVRKFSAASPIFSPVRELRDNSRGLCLLHRRTMKSANLLFTPTRARRRDR